MFVFPVNELGLQGAHVSARCHMLQAGRKHVYVESGDARVVALRLYKM